jgi:hypothetical protein
MVTDTVAAAESLKDMTVNAVKAAAATDMVVANESRKDTDAKVVIAAVSLVEDIPPAEDATTNPVAKTTGAKAGRTSETTTRTRADTEATVVSQVENGAMAKGRVAMVRDRRVTRNATTIQAVIDPARVTANRGVGMTTIAAARNVAGGIKRQTPSRRGLVTKRLSAVVAWMHSANSAGVDRRTIVVPTSASRKMLTIV